ncbi:auxin response factor 3-like isoform X1 [Papaver somniferum]|uniref:auxin response factor 3-like isoform X1 n=1 Tax=Papaver somniferum TaxID=3469 RepID=UPI000E6FDDCB|nr:auxin response factor 3-like isoform X1 [Papaver somniferum]
MGGLIDLNNILTEDEDDDTTTTTLLLSSSSPSSTTTPPPSVCLELWHACAGPHISLPKKNTLVVYLPQGHLEHISQIPPSVVYDLPPHVFCRVVDVALRAELTTDEVYAQVSLIPDTEVEQKLKGNQMEENMVFIDEEEIEGAGGLSNNKSSSSSSTTTPHMFCKTLTASDTSTHGGFSVPRRAAEDCFPPLDYKQQRPSQELVAKDLHGMVWKFRHIYRGQPRRHLLTTGWSAFVNNKKLVSGDAVLFLRGEDGELRLGVRRATQCKSGGSFSVFGSQTCNTSTLTSVAKAVASKTLFHINYTPRVSPSEFLIPFQKFSKGSGLSLSIGMRFKMRFETEDSTEQRYTGMIAGISEMDPVRWPGSKWRCLLVRWDDNMEMTRQNRVSPWEIEPSSSFSGSGNLSPPGAKRAKIRLPAQIADFPAPNGGRYLDFGESFRFQKVLQGQEILGLNPSYDGYDVQNHQPFGIRRCDPGSNSNGMAGILNGVKVLSGTSEIPNKGVGFGESDRFPKVLQGQELYSKAPQMRGLVDNRSHDSGEFGYLDGVHRSTNGSAWPAMLRGYSDVQTRAPSVKVSSPSSVLMFQQASTRAANPGHAYAFNNNHEKEDSASMFAPELWKEHQLMDFMHPPTSFVNRAGLMGERGLATSRNGCRLFGFPLTEETQVANEEDISTTPITSPSSNENLNPDIPYVACTENYLDPTSSAKAFGQRCTKILQVHKQGSVAGRAIDLTKLEGYPDLISELERLFNMEGLLNDPKKGWQVVYTDQEDEMMLIGDGPWKEFCNIVSKILIYTRDQEVVEMDNNGNSSEGEVGIFGIP